MIERISTYREYFERQRSGLVAIRCFATKTCRSRRAVGARANFVDKQKLRDIFGYWLMVPKTVGAGVAAGESRLGIPESNLIAAQNPVGPLPQAQRETE